MFYPKLPAGTRASFPDVLALLYAQRFTGHVLLQLRNGEAIRVARVETAVELDTPAARPSPADAPEVTSP